MDFEDFYFLERERNVEELCSSIASIFLNFQYLSKQTNSRRNLILTVMYGGSGIGKTRFGYQTSTILPKITQDQWKIALRNTDVFVDNMEQNIEMHANTLVQLFTKLAYVFIDFSNGDDTLFRSEKLNVDEILANLLFLKLFFKNQRYGKISTIYTPQNLSVYNVISAYKIYNKIDNLPILIHLDEFQETVEKPFVKWKKKEIKIVKFLEKLMYSVGIVGMTNPLDLLIPLCTGTIDVSMLDLFPSTSYGLVKTTFAPLSSKSRYTIVQEYLKLKQLTDKQKMLIDTSGGVGKFIEKIIQFWNEDSSITFLKASSTLAKHYTNIENSDILLALAVTGIAVSPELKINEQTILERAIKGDFFIREKTNEELIDEAKILHIDKLDDFIFSRRSKLIVEIPFIILSYFAVNTDFPVQFLNFSPILQFSDMERFHSYFMQLKYNCLQKIAGPVIKLNVLEKGAYMNKNTANIDVSLNTKMKCYTSKKDTDLIQISTNGPEIEVMNFSHAVDVLHECCSIHVGRTWPESDVLTLIPNNLPSQSPIVITTEIKSTIPKQESINPTQTSKTFEQSINDGLDWINKNLGPYNVTGLAEFVTNKKISNIMNPEQNLPDNQLLVCKNNFTTYYSEIFKPLLPHKLKRTDVELDQLCEKLDWNIPYESV